MNEIKNIKIYEGNCVDVMQTLDAESIDLIITDPPYNTGFVKNEKANRLNNFFDDSYTNEEYNQLLLGSFNEAYRLLKDNSPIYVFIDWRNLCVVKNNIEKAGFKIKQVLVWDKVIHGLNYQNYAYQFELIIYASKGDYFHKRIKLKKDILKYQRVNNNNSIDHETVKPVSLIRDLILESSNEDDVILDMFAGSGTTGVACVQTNRKGILIEKESKYINIIKERIKKTSNLNYFLV